MFSSLQSRLTKAVQSVQLPASLAGNTGKAGEHGEEEGEHIDATGAAEEQEANNEGEQQSADANTQEGGGGASSAAATPAQSPRKPYPAGASAQASAQQSPAKPPPPLPDTIEACHVRLRKYEEKLTKAAELAQRYKALSQRHQALEAVLTKHTPLGSLGASDAVEMLESFLAGRKEGEDLMKEEVRRLTTQVDEAKRGGDKALQSKLRDKEEVRSFECVFTIEVIVDI